MAGAKQFPLWQAGVGAGRARLSSGRRSRNQSGARTFLSAATSNGSKALERSDPAEYSGVAADRNVRAPVASQKSSRFAQTFAYSKPARRGPGHSGKSSNLARSWRAGTARPTSADAHLP